MASDGDDNLGLILGVVFALIVLVAALVFGVAIRKEAPRAAPASSAPATDAASVVVENGVVKFYFATGKADLANGANAALKAAVEAAASGKELAVSGFHDATADAAVNALLPCVTRWSPWVLQLRKLSSRSPKTPAEPARTPRHAGLRSPSSNVVF